MSAVDSGIYGEPIPGENAGSSHEPTNRRDPASDIRTHGEPDRPHNQRHPRHAIKWRSPNLSPLDGGIYETALDGWVHDDTPPPPPKTPTGVNERKPTPPN